MSTSRGYQIEELTRGIQLPLPRLQRRPLQAIVELLIEAWNGLLETHEQVLRTVEEKEVNALMDARLNTILEQTPELRMLATGVTRGRETLNYNGSKLETRPDLSINLTCRSTRFPLLVECKLIDKSSRKGVGLYCKEGLTRFVSGQYAWYAQEAFLLAYVRDRSTISTRLAPYLEKNQQKVADPFCTEQLPNTGMCPRTDLAQSRHGRRFLNNPGSIEIWHLWLS